ncbi:MAG TPA: pantetheine-phosphate adenylyltransferase [Candidatus Cloacimonadota bacterium]|jgi:pantetheine-phosphate adenylyltransferase|nr:pantetheine-phosphate adenylyltransferase [Candidatus Cloacimonadota bacterium]HOD53205.1 pantetheine-phosphate adenylyltransferase [Candidatus Cloacimonadota bacterium]HPM01039.1 pantetheine-phosphate adenylyltransferase [Candidatus Cloacimonadota bacterium]
MKKAIYPGTFDPITNGHINILQKATLLFDEVILAVANITGKNTLFTTEERLNLCRQSVKHIHGVQVVSFDGLVVEFARQIEAVTMVRGLRAVSDFEYELQLALMNKSIYQTIDTIFLVPDSQYLYLSSSMVRQIVGLGGRLHDQIPEVVENAIIEKFNALNLKDLKNKSNI